MLSIIQSPNQVLSATAKPVTKVDKEIHDLIKQMTETLINAKDPEGVGLAAPQVGKSLQLFIVKQSPDAKVQVFINPTIQSIGELDTNVKPNDEEEKKKRRESVKLEGCLSLADIWGVVNRYKAVKLSYTDEIGASHERTFSGFLATILQHECDHLQGVLFPKRVFEQQGTLYKSSKNAKGETVFDEITL